MHASEELSRLVEMSARIGAEPNLIQGPGGNTSLKQGEFLVVKASGFWLANAMDENIFVTLSLPAIRERIATGQGDDFLSCLVGDTSLKPSIETAFHALLPHRVVIHAHAYNCMAISTMPDGKQRFLTAMGPAISGAWVPYRRPGGPLAHEIAAILAQRPVDVLLLQNHGVVVGANSAEAAEALLHDVEQRLALQERARLAVEWTRVVAHTTPDYLPDPVSSDIALDPELVRIAGHLPLIPDQVVFLGGAVCVADPALGIDRTAAAVKVASGVQPGFVLLPGVGAYRWVGRAKAADPLIDGLVALLRRLPSGIEVNTLTIADTAELLGWDAEHYRQRLDRKYA
ncbi:class II aldolase [Bradyrhizobium japonicum]|nr:class II aldolase [Bradyrhizobium japonicum]